MIRNYNYYPKVNYGTHPKIDFNKLILLPVDAMTLAKVAD